MVLLGTTDSDGCLVMARFRTVFIKGREHVVSLRLFSELQGWGFVPEGFECDGCTMSPDAWRGYKLWPACVIHDLAYGFGIHGGTWAGRWRVDKEFRHNLKRLLELQGAPWHLTAVLPWVYWRVVRLAGASHYAFRTGEKARTPWERYREVRGLFVSKLPVPLPEERLDG